jgi:hypothetical protein
VNKVIKLVCQRMFRTKPNAYYGAGTAFPIEKSLGSYRAKPSEVEAVKAELQSIGPAYRDVMKVVDVLASPRESFAYLKKVDAYISVSEKDIETSEQCLEKSREVIGQLSHIYGFSSQHVETTRNCIADVFINKIVDANPSRLVLDLGIMDHEAFAHSLFFCQVREMEVSGEITCSESVIKALGQASSVFGSDNKAQYVFNRLLDRESLDLGLMNPASYSNASFLMPNLGKLMLAIKAKRWLIINCESVDKKPLSIVNWYA